jgi:phosphoribosylanthranilate isomerase
MIVKICGVTNREDAEASVAGGATALGFNFYPPSPRYIHPEKASELGALVPPGVLRVGVFVNEPAGLIVEIAGQAGLDVLQLHGECGAPEGMRVWRALPVGPGFSASQLDRIQAEAFLLDALAGDSYGGTGTTFDWSLARGLRHKILLAGGLDAANVAEAICTARPWGVDACSRIEISPGRKDPVRLAAFLKAALEAGQLISEEYV